MIRYIPILAIVGVIAAVIFAAGDKLIAKIDDAKKQRYAKIALYAAIYFCVGCVCVEVVDWCK